MAIYNKGGDILTVAYNKNGDVLTSAYNKNGDMIPLKDYSHYTITDYCTCKTNMQGFDIFNGVIFQFMGNDRMSTINVSTQSVIKSMISCAAGHGDSASFSDEYYDNNDDYPLIYVTADTNPAQVYINRVTTTTSELVKTLLFPLEQAGYYAAACLDVDNDIIYMVGYTQDSYFSSANDNKTVISKWNLSNLTENQDGTFTPEFISSFERDFISVTQGQQYHNGLLWVTSTGTNEMIYALDPDNGAIVWSYNLQLESAEVEGVAWISDNEMVVGYQPDVYKLFTFDFE